MDNLIPLIKKKKIRVDSFAENVLGISYRTFKYRLDNKLITHEDAKKIIAYLGCTFEDLEKPGNKPKSIIEEMSKTKESNTNASGNKPSQTITIIPPIVSERAKPEGAENENDLLGV